MKLTALMVILGGYYQMKLQSYKNCFFLPSEFLTRSLQSLFLTPSLKNNRLTLPLPLQMFWQKEIIMHAKECMHQMSQKL
jgi:hypothetical protein